MPTTTCLHAVHERLGASFVDFAGWSMPVRYSSELAEHAAVRERAGLFDLTHMTELEVQGADAGGFLDHATVGSPSRLAVGRARYTMLCREDGGILDDLIVYRLAEQHFLVVANAGNAEVVRTALGERSGGFSVAVHDTSADWALLAIQGPRSADVLGRLSPSPLDELRYYGIDRGLLAGRRVLLARTGYTGEDGFEVLCRPADATHLWDEITRAGEDAGLAPAGLAARDTLRLEAGMPLYGRELTVHTTPFDAGLGGFVDLAKDDFVGGEALRERSSREGEVTLVGLVGQGRRSPRPGNTVLAADGSTPVGTITSGAPSPTLGHPVAMAYVSAGLASPGNRLVVDVRGSLQEVRTCALPFYRRDDRRKAESS